MEKLRNTGYIYVLTNESFHRDNWVKIGYAEDVEKRAKELSGTSVPLPFKIYCTYEIPRIKGTKDPDKLVHDLIRAINPDIRITKNKEFFELYPWDAYEMLRAIAQMHGRQSKLHRNEENKTGQEIEPSTYSVEDLFPKDGGNRNLYEKLKELIASIDGELLETPLKLYDAFKKGEKNNVVALWPKEQWIEVVLTAKRGTIDDKASLTYDISNRRWTAAQYAFRFDEETDLAAVKDLIQQTYNLR